VFPSPHGRSPRQIAVALRSEAPQRAAGPADAQAIPTCACVGIHQDRVLAVAPKVGRHRVEYPREVVEAMPPALRRAFEASPARIR